MRNIRKWIGLFILLVPVYRYVGNWREENEKKEAKS